MKQSKSYKKVIVFVRIKYDPHCFNFLTSKRVKVLWKLKRAAVIEIDELMYNCEHDWLINHPNLSCLTEIQLIKLK